MVPILICFNPFLFRSTNAYFFSESSSTLCPLTRYVTGSTDSYMSLFVSQNLISKVAPTSIVANFTVITKRYVPRFFGSCPDLSLFYLVSLSSALGPLSVASRFQGVFPSFGPQSSEFSISPPAQSFTHSRTKHASRGSLTRLANRF